MQTLERDVESLNRFSCYRWRLFAQQRLRKQFFTESSIIEIVDLLKDGCNFLEWFRNMVEEQNSEAPTSRALSVRKPEQGTAPHPNSHSQNYNVSFCSVETRFQHAKN